ncbi:MAG: nitroreductase family protein [Chloroflexi bacterium]|jgi:nitroreductase|nr:nitroreductase family protein [Chloroflexota bacterium]
MEYADVVRTTFAARDFTDESLDDDVLYRILDLARFAPSGGNRQPWKVVVLKDAEKRKRVAELSVPTFRRYLAQRFAGENPWNTIEPTKLSDEQIAEGPDPSGYLQSMLDAPAVLMVFVDLRLVASFDSDLPRVGVISGASVYPFVWNILLAARDLGYGGTITTFPAGAEAEVQELFGMPPYMAAAALVPLGRPAKQLTKLKRNAVEELATIDRADGAPLASRPTPR